MSKIDFIRGEMVAAMKAKDKARKDVLSLLLAELKKFEINNTELQRCIEKENRNKNYKLWVKLAKKHGVS